MCHRQLIMRRQNEGSKGMNSRYIQCPIGEPQRRKIEREEGVGGRKKIRPKLYSSMAVRGIVIKGTVA